MNRAGARLGLAVGIAIALGGCTDRLDQSIECVHNATGDKFTAKAGTRTKYVGGREAIPVRDKDGFTMWVTTWNMDKWRCRSVAGGAL